MFVNVLDKKYENNTQNYRKLIDSEPNLAKLVTKDENGDDAIYMYYIVEPDAIPFAGFFVYRHDLFEKHNLKVETWEEMYGALKVLKNEYPDSFPMSAFVQGGNLTLLGLYAPKFRTSDDLYYNHDKDAWVYGPTEDEYEYFLGYMARLYKEGLLHPESASMSYEQWSQAFVKNETFVSCW